MTDDRLARALIGGVAAFSGAAGLIALIAMLLSIYEMWQHIATGVGAGIGLGITLRVGRKPQ